MPSVMRARLFETKPKISSTKNAENIANNEICNTLVLCTNIFLFFNNSNHVLQVSKNKRYDNVICDKVIFCNVGHEFLLYSSVSLTDISNSYNGRRCC